MRIFDRELSAPKGFWDGTHRTRSPAQTLAAYGPRMGELGVTRLADVSGLDHLGVPVFTAMRPNSRSRAVFEGKGMDRDAARASALMEAIEGWHAERVELPLRHESLAALRRAGEPVLDIRRLALYPGAVLREEAPLLWVQGHELMSGAPCWVPFECVTTNCVRSPQLPPTFGVTTNGLASGNHLLEAIVHALCELIERDACALWQLAGGAQRKDLQLELASVRDPAARGLIERLHDAGLEVAVWEATSDIAVPAFECQLFERPETMPVAPKGLHSGQGCHLDPAVALMRALTEAVQSRAGASAGGRDDVFDYEPAVDLDELRVLQRALADPPPTRPFPHDARVTDSFEGDVAVIVEALACAGIEQAAVVDLTRPDVGVPVAKVVVPGLERARDPGDNALGARGRAAAAHVVG